jgi:probable DNA metabolism protein
MTACCYRYDGSFEGLLSAYAQALAAGEPAGTDFVPRAGRAPPTLFGSRDVGVYPEAAAGLLRDLAGAGGEQVPRTLALAYLSELPGCERALYEYGLVTLERRECVDGWHSHPAIGCVTGAVRSVARETHRFQGLLRFRQTEQGVFYAPFAPDHNISLPLGRYFATRLADQRWVIHDCRRELAVLWDGQALQPACIRPGAGADHAALPLSAEEQAVQHLWRTYHRGIAIATRANPRLQRHFMPRKYWRYLTEMQPA